MVPVATFLLPEEVNSFPQAVGAMERILAKASATIDGDDLQTMDNVLRFVVENLPQSARSADGGDGNGASGRWEWRTMSYRGCFGRLRCMSRCVWVPSEKKSRSADGELSVLRRKVDELAGAIVDIPANPAIDRGDFARQVYGVTLSADDISAPGRIVRE